ncbi:MAG: metallophosphoesterase [Clostridiales Family XIII bacterium]|jgi:hypothetical protein|nr:metallophosphoesterase [Clostridiales Family XIII bacterium]
MKRTVAAALIAVMVAAALAASLVAGALFPQMVDGAYAAGTEETLVAANSQWLYEDSDADLFGDAASDFRSKGFDDTAWKSGNGPLGYPATDRSNYFGAVSEGTTVASRANPNAILTYYFRKHFNVTNIADIEALTARVAVDDGYVLYLNGHEVSRLNMPEGAVGAGTTSLAVWEPTETRANVTLDLSAFRQYLIVGDNVIAADVHNRDANSSDIYFGMELKATYGEGGGEPAPEADKTPTQANVHLGDDAQTEVNFTYTTVAEQPTTVTLTADVPGAQDITVTGESSVGASNKYFHKIAVSGLASGTAYTYRLGAAPNTVDGRFKTAPSPDTDEAITFAYLADTQVSNATNAEALGATLAEVQSMNPDFVYLAGDVTDTATNETQWEQLFENGGAFPHGGADMFRNFAIATVQGNHDNITFNRHINAPATSAVTGQDGSGNSLGNIVYTFDYGPITFIMLNLETARGNAGARAEMKSFLEGEVAKAKALGRWTAVGFHKSLVTGASHITDSDVVDARKYWCPVFAQLDVDFVLQGHDHVYSRGFVDESGYKAAVETNSAGTVDPENAPLYMIGGHAGGLKWYALKNYTVAPGDPIAPGYSFLDVNSADPANNAFGTDSSVVKEQVVVEFTATRDKVDINTYMFKYDEATDQITTPKYLYDSLTVVREGAQPAAETEAKVEGPAQTVLESDEELVYTVSYKGLVGADAFDTAIEYDKDALELVRVDGLANKAFSHVEAGTPGKARIIQGLEASDAITSDSYAAVCAFVFKPKAGTEAEQAGVKLTRADTVKSENGAAEDVAARIEAGEVSTEFYSQNKAADVNGDGKVTLADLSEAIKHYREQTPGSKYDVNRDGTVDTEDFLIISRLIMGQ